MTFKDGVKTHIVDSTAMLAASTPVFAGLETLVLEMSHQVSINARTIATYITYLGMGYVMAKGRDIYRKALKITDETKESIQKVHDAIYGGAYNIIIAPAFYYASGCRDIEEIIGGTLMSIGFGLGAGGIIGYSIDVYRDLTGIKKNPKEYLNS